MKRTTLIAAVLTVLFSAIGLSRAAPAGMEAALAGMEAALAGTEAALAEPEELLTRAERSAFTQTSRYAEVLEFLHALEKESDCLRVEFFGVSAEGRPLPLAVLGDPPPAGPGDVDREAATVVFIQANIHAGEVEGKEACLMLLREIVRGELSHLLEGTVLLVAPDFNADGNERVSKEHRSWQFGPEHGVGVRSNAQSLDLNRDFIKAESPEVQAHLEGVLLRWDPDLLVDCHTTNGSLHREPITYAWPHSPLGDRAVAGYVRAALLPWAVDATLRRDGYPAIPYGNWLDRREPSKGWRTYGCEARYGTNYWGLRNRLSVLIEIYAYADFETRVRSCFSFLRSILEFSHANGSQMRSVVRAADRHAAGSEGGERFYWEFKPTACDEPVTIMGFEPAAGRRPDPRRPGKPVEYTVPYFGAFVPVGEGKELPGTGYVFPRGHVTVRAKLVQHGIEVEEIAADVEAEVEVFEIESITPAENLYQGHRPTTLTGKWTVRKTVIEAGSWFVPTAQPLRMLAAFLLEPESGDGLAYWNFMDRFITRGNWDPSPGTYPVMRW